MVLVKKKKKKPEKKVEKKVEKKKSVSKLKSKLFGLSWQPPPPPCTLAVPVVESVNLIWPESSRATDLDSAIQTKSPCRIWGCSKPRLRLILKPETKNLLGGVFLPAAEKNALKAGGKGWWVGDERKKLLQKNNKWAKSCHLVPSHEQP